MSKQTQQLIGVPVKHYSNVFQSTSEFHHHMTDDFGETNTDTSSWRPDISIARAQAAIAGGKQLLYDFPDGKDTGEYVQTFVRQKGLDITEIETAERRITQVIEDKKLSDEAKAKADEQQKLVNDALTSMKEGKTSASESSDVSLDTATK